MTGVGGICVKCAVVARLRKKKNQSASQKLDVRKARLGLVVLSKMNASEHLSQQCDEPPTFRNTKPDFPTNHGEPV